MNSNISFDSLHHEFKISQYDSESIFGQITTPLSVILQVTRRCDLKCNFCSESQLFNDPDIKDVISLIPNLSGGEPLLREDIFDMIYEFKRNFPVIGLPTNTTKITKQVCKKIYGKVNYINAGIDGPRRINNFVRGNYDEIINGLLILKENGLEVSLSSVILKDTLPYLHQVVQIADVLGVIKVKMVIPILRGRASALTEGDFASKVDILNKFDEIKKMKEALALRPRVKLTFWDKNPEGYALIIYPDFNVYAWPVFDK